jgi:hypothetical protein
MLSELQLQTSPSSTPLSTVHNYGAPLNLYKQEPLSTFNHITNMNFQSGDLAICPTCGTQFDVPLSAPLSNCRICDVRDVAPSSLPPQH